MALPCGLALRSLPQRRDGKLRTQKNPGQVHGTEAVPFVEACLLDAFPEKHARIVDEDVEPAPSRGRSTDCGIPVFFAGHIEALKHRTGVSADRAGGFPSALLENVADHHPGSRLDHQPRSFGADAARRPRNQGDLAVEPVHCCPPAELVGK